MHSDVAALSVFEVLKCSHRALFQLRMGTAKNYPIARNRIMPFESSCLRTLDYDAAGDKTLRAKRDDRSALLGSLTREYPA